MDGFSYDSKFDEWNEVFVVDAEAEIPKEKPFRQRRSLCGIRSKRRSSPPATRREIGGSELMCSRRPTMPSSCA
jgi:hypothetical protein